MIISDFSFFILQQNWNALILASQRGHFEIVEILLRAFPKSDIDIKCGTVRSY